MSGSRLVYSTVGGRVRQPDERPTTPDRPAAKSGVPNDGVIRIFRERGGRNGKVVTVVRGLPSGAALTALAADLKRLCGAGGTVKGGALEIQGDHRERLAERLREQGYPVKLAGG
ncbi:MAG: stress response translation initiation inhibitor YciH [candidate division NC10 bacterium]|nr:stress response translation initiation inhibitor YciH [candidate division NC10 bacterium]